MTNIINLIEKLGSKVEGRQVSEAELISMLKEHGVVVTEDASVVAAIEQVVKARSNVVCGVFPAEEPGKEQPDDDNDDNDDKSPESRLLVNG